MAAYAISRQRTMKGMGTTYAFRPRLRGVGQDLTPPDIGLPTLAPPPELPGATPGPSIPPGFYSGATGGGPSTVYGPIAPLAPAPTITAQAPTAPPALTVVFPFQGSTFAPLAPPGGAASWFQGSTLIAGMNVPNGALALGIFGIAALALSAGKRRR